MYCKSLLIKASECLNVNVKCKEHTSVGVERGASEFVFTPSLNVFLQTSGEQCPSSSG